MFSIIVGFFYIGYDPNYPEEVPGKFSFSLQNAKKNSDKHTMVNVKVLHHLEYICLSVE